MTRDERRVVQELVAAATQVNVTCTNRLPWDQLLLATEAVRALLTPQPEEEPGRGIPPVTGRDGLAIVKCSTCRGWLVTKEEEDAGIHDKCVARARTAVLQEAAKEADLEVAMYDRRSPQATALRLLANRLHAAAEAKLGSGGT